MSQERREAAERELEAQRQALADETPTAEIPTRELGESLLRLRKEAADANARVDELHGRIARALVTLRALAEDVHHESLVGREVRAAIETLTETKKETQNGDEAETNRG